MGAWDGKHLSNTYALLNSSPLSRDDGLKGSTNNDNNISSNCWAGILFEADIDRFKSLQELYATKEDVKCVQSLVSLSGPQSLSKQLEEYNVSKSADLLSIDVDGCDYHMWREVILSFDDSTVPADMLQVAENGYRPRVVVIEFNPTVPNHVYFVQAADINVHQGSSLLALQELGRQFGYTIIATTVFNAIFLRDDLMEFMPTEVEKNPQLDQIHRPSMVTDLFQTYDGELKLVGPKKLFWHKLAINPQKLQVLARRDRRFPFAPANNWSRQLDEFDQAAVAYSHSATSGHSSDAALGDVTRRCKELLAVSCLQGLVLDRITRLLLQVEQSFSASAVSLRCGLATVLEDRGDAEAKSGSEDEGMWFSLAIAVLDALMPTRGGPCEEARDSFRSLSTDLSTARLRVKLAKKDRLKGGEALLSSDAHLREAARLISAAAARGGGESGGVDEVEVVEMYQKERRKCDAQKQLLARSSADGEIAMLTRKASPIRECITLDEEAVGEGAIATPLDLMKGNGIPLRPRERIPISSENKELRGLFINRRFHFVWAIAAGVAAGWCLRSLQR